MITFIELIMGFDFGTKNIGIAIGQKLTNTARPLTSLKYHVGIINWKHIQCILNKWSPTILVVGLPLNKDGSEQPITNLAKRFAEELKNRFQITVEMHDERFSTIEARIDLYKNIYKNRRNQIYHYYTKHYLHKNNNQHINAISAQIILNSWLQTKKIKASA